MNYIQGLPSPGFSLPCFFNCKTRGLEVVATQSPSNVHIKLEGFIFTKLFHIVLLVFTSTKLDSSPLLKHSEHPGLRVFLLMKFYNPNFFSCSQNTVSQSPAQKPLLPQSSDLPSQTIPFLSLDFSNLGFVPPKAHTLQLLLHFRAPPSLE